MPFLAANINSGQETPLERSLELWK